MNIIKKYYYMIKYRKPFTHPSGMRFESYRDFLDYLTKPKFNHKNLMSIMKANTIRCRIIEPFDLNRKQTPYVIVKAPKNKLDRIRKAIDPIKPVMLHIEYRELKWNEGWFPRYAFERLD